MGMQTAPAQLFYDFCLDDHIPEDHLLRRIDRFLDLEKVRTELRPFYSSIGRPSIDPELMMRMLIVGRETSCAATKRACRSALRTACARRRRPGWRTPDAAAIRYARSPGIARCPKWHTTPRPPISSGWHGRRWRCRSGQNANRFCPAHRSGWTKRDASNGNCLPKIWQWRSQQGSHLQQFQWLAAG